MVGIKTIRKGGEKYMPFETYEDIPGATDGEVMDFLHEQILIVLKKANLNKRIFIAAFNTILADIRRRLDLKE